MTIDRLTAALNCAACQSTEVVTLPEMIRPARHERFGLKVYYSPETRLVDWPSLGDRRCPLCRGDVTLAPLGYTRQAVGVRAWAADRWRRARGVMVGLLHTLARTPLDPWFTPEVFRFRGG